MIVRIEVVINKFLITLSSAAFNEIKIYIGIVLNICDV